MFFINTLKQTSRKLLLELKSSISIGLVWSEKGIRMKARKCFTATQKQDF